LDTFGRGEGGGGGGHQSWAVSVVIGVMFRQPEAVNAVVFGQSGVFDEFLICLSERARVCRC
jgi:hypothetical protein